MIGYVMDNELAKAFREVKAVIESGRSKLKISRKGICHPSAVLSDYQWSIDTQHGSSQKKGRENPSCSFAR
jgi:hypothetical protein